MKRKNLWLVGAFALGVIVTKLLSGDFVTHEDKFALFNEDLTRETDKIVARIQANPTAAGVACAHKILTDATPRLKQEISDLKALEQSNVPYVTLKQFRTNIIENRNKFMALQTKNLAVQVAAKTDAQFLSAMQMLLNDYKSIIN